jgi:moderate conductance mechanosensitive channel
MQRVWVAVLCLVVTLAGLPATAQPPAAPSPAAPPAAAPPAAPPARPALTTDQARQALDVLNDPKKRAEVAATLEAIVKAQPAAKPSDAPAATPPASASPGTTVGTTPPGDTPAPAAAVLPLAPDSLGADVLVSAAAFLNHAGSEAMNALRAIRSIPLLWGWVVVMATDPWGQALLMDVAWRLAVAFAVGFAVQSLVARLLRRPLAGVASWAPREPEPPEEDNGEARAERGDIEPPRRRRFASWARLRRLPMALARLLLELVPVLGFALAGHLIAGSSLGGERLTQLVLLAVIDATAICVATLYLVDMVLAPAHPQQRLLHLSDNAAGYLMRWLRRLIVFTVFGGAVAEVGLLLGLSELAHEAVLKGVVGIDHVLLAIIVLQKRRPVRRWIKARDGDTGVFARLRNLFAGVWHWFALAYLIAAWLIWAVAVPHGYELLLHFFVVSVLVLAGARLVLSLSLSAIDRLLRLGPDLAERHPGIEARLAVYHPLMHRVVRIVVFVIALLLLLQFWGVHVIDWFAANQLGQRLLSSFGALAVTVLLAIAVWEGINAAMEQHLAKLGREAQLARSARLRTLLPIIRTTVLVTILLVAGLMVLSEIGVNIAPLLAGAGIAGVALGFGSQKLVQDFITGLFLLLENAMQVGDTITVAGLSGTVEALSVRTIKLRATDGSVHIIPFSSVGTVTNTNRGLGNAAVSVTVAYQEDTDRVCDVLREIGAELRKEPDFSARMLGDLQLFGVDQLNGASATITGQIVCTDAGRWPVQREFNRRVKQRFAAQGIALFNPAQSWMIKAAPAAQPEAPAAPAATATPAAAPGG